MTKDKYEEPTIQEREIIKINLYEEFEKQFSKEYKQLNPEELEHKRNEYVETNFHEALYKNKK